MADETTNQAPTWGGKPLKQTSFGTPAWLDENLGKDNPLPWQQYYDKGVVDPSNSDSLVSRQLARGEDYYKNTANHGLNDQPMDVAMPGFTGGSGRQSPMSEAISRKYQKDVSGKLRGMQTQNEANAPLQRSKALSQAEHVMTSAQQLENKNFQDQYAFQMQRWNLQQQHNAALEQANRTFLANAIGAGVSIATLGMGGGK